MIQYIEEIFIPYVDRQREDLGDTSKAAVIIMDNFKGQITSQVNDLLEDNNINVCLLPPNTTDLLQPMDIAVNKPAKDFLKRKFEQWYSEEVTKQLEGVSEIESAELQPLDFSMAVVKELTAKWLVEMVEYLADNPQFIVRGFKRAGISDALDDHAGVDLDESSSEDEDVLSEESLSSCDAAFSSDND